VEANTLHFKILSDQLVKIDMPSDYIAPHQSGRAISKLKRIAQLIENLQGKKRDLSFVILLIIEEAIAANAMPGCAFDQLDLGDRIFIRFAPMVAKKVMARRNVKMTDFQRDNAIIAEPTMPAARGSFCLHEKKE